MAASTHPRSVRPYNPPQHLLAHWNAADLRMHFQAFRDSLRYVRDAPELVFERLVGSLNHGFEITANQHRSLVDQLRAEKKQLQESVTQLRAELAESQGNRQPSRPSTVEPAKVGNSVLDLRDLPPPPPPAGARLVCKFIAAAKEVHGICKTSTAACPIALGGCTWDDIGHLDPTFQSGQTTFSSDAAGVLERLINFGTAFVGTAEVLVWLTHIDYHGALSVKVDSEDITTTEFLLKLTIGASCNVQEVGVAWVAYPAAPYKIYSGTGNTSSVQVDWRCPLFEHTGLAPITLDYLIVVPKKLVAISAVEVGECAQVVVDTSGNLFSAYIDEPNFTWKIAVTPKEAKVYSVGVSWLLIV